MSMRMRKSLMHMGMLVCMLSYVFAAAAAPAPTMGTEESKEDRGRTFTVPADYKRWTKPEQFEEYLGDPTLIRRIRNYNEVIGIIGRYFEVLIETYKEYNPHELIAQMVGNEVEDILEFIKGEKYYTICNKSLNYLSSSKNPRLSEILESRRFEAIKARKPTLGETLYHWLTGTGYTAVEGGAGTEDKKSA